jgi:hypothetical protein
MTVRAVAGGKGRVRTGRVGAQGPGGGGGVSPVFQTDFTAISSLPTGVSLTRSTTGTRFNSSGVLVAEAIDAPRFDYAWNGSAWVAAGLLIEEVRTNTILQSVDLSNGVWQFPAAASSVAHTGATNKSGSASWRLTSSTASAVHGIQQQVTLAAGVLSVALDVKYVDNQWIALGVYDSGYKIASFDVLNGVKGSFADTGFTSTIKSLGGGWYRITATYTAVSANPYFAFFLNQIDFSVQTWAPSSAVSVDIDFPQFEAGAFATSYIPTTSAAVTRNADVATVPFNAPTAGTMIIEWLHSPDVDGTNPVISSNGNNPGWTVGAAEILPSGSRIGHTPITSAPNRGANAWDASSYSSAFNGVLSQSSITPTQGTVTGVAFGYSTTSAFGQPNTRIRSVALYTSRLSDATLQAKSVVGAAF